MKVIPVWPGRASTGTRAFPVRGVNAECRTSLENCPAFFRNVMFNISFYLDVFPVTSDSEPCRICERHRFSRF